MVVPSDRLCGNRSIVGIARRSHNVQELGKNRQAARTLQISRPYLNEIENVIGKRLGETVTM
jgi:hypothetical protein